MGICCRVRHAVAGERAVEVDVAIEEDFIRDGGTGERVPVPEDEVGIFADIDGVDAIVDTDDRCGVEGDHLEGFFFGGTDRAHGLGGFLIQAAGEIVGVAFDGDAHAFAHGHDRVPRDGVPGFLLVARPIGEGGDADVFGSELFGNLVGFESVMEGADFVAELLGDGDLDQELVGAVKASQWTSKLLIRVEGSSLRLP
jgi:hypothetical protein